MTHICLRSPQQIGINVGDHLRLKHAGGINYTGLCNEAQKKSKHLYTLAALTWQILHVV